MIIRCLRAERSETGRATKKEQPGEWAVVTVGDSIGGLQSESGEASLSEESGKRRSRCLGLSCGWRLVSRTRGPLRSDLAGIERCRDERANPPKPEVVGFPVSIMEDIARVHDARECRVEVLGASGIEQFENRIPEFGIAEIECFWLLLYHS